jgi:hypothetical protein
MKKILRDHPEIILVTLALVLLVFIISYFVWGIGDVVVSVNDALKAPPPPSSIAFQLEDASQLDLRGLMQP